jgi:multimeric flavodoxin WrbA
MAKVLVIYHSQSGNTSAAADMVSQAAGQVADTEVIVKKALDATADDLLSCDAIAIGTPDYFSYMAGGLKDFFDRTFYPTRGAVTGKPCGLFLTHGGGGRAIDSVKRLCGSFKFHVVDSPVLVLNRPDDEAKKALEILGKRVAEAAKKGPVQDPAVD